MRNYVDVMMGSDDSVTSPVWTCAGWRIQFVRLAAGEQLTRDASAGTSYVKVVTGGLASPDRRAYAADRVVRTTRVDVDDVRAGADGALCAVFTETDEVPDIVSSVDALRIDGPDPDRFVWRTFESKYHALTPWFDGLDAHLAPGWRLLDGDGAEIAHVFLWAAGKGVDLSTHNHGRPPSPEAPAFAEVHLVLFNGTGSGGMYETPAPGAPERVDVPMQRGEEHGPFFAVDEATGAPKLRDNGAVDYPWHGWAAGTDADPGQAFDVVAAFEITVPFALTR